MNLFCKTIVSVNFVFKRICNRIYTWWIKSLIGTMGAGTRVYYPCSLHGGGSQNINIGENTCIQSHCILGCWLNYNNDLNHSSSIIIGNNCTIGEYCQISAIKKITIGNGLLTGRYVYIGDNSHGGLSWREASIPPARRELKSKGEIIIGNNVWVGERVTILGGITIGDNVIIGANSVVTHDVPSNSVVAGVPARIVKQLNDVVQE